MPETNKVDEREEASSKAEEPGIGAKKAARFLAELSLPKAEAPQQEPETAFQAPKASHETPPEAREEKSIDTFAESVASSLKQAGIEIDDEDVLNEEKDKAGFLADWEEFGEIHELSSEQEVVKERTEELQPFEAAGGLRTLSEIALASGPHATAEGSPDSGSDHSSKHDELADAVQAALMSVYGEPASAPPPTSRQVEALTFSPDVQASGPGWATEDNLSPQDVILNYFDYQPATQTGRHPASDQVNGDAGYDGDAAGAFGQPPDYLAPQRRPQWSRSPDAYADYDGPPSYPVPAGYTAPSKTAAAERESSRLLGAAAIGLVGGIAIAASLAVFVINSYGPGVRVASGAANQASDASEPGYGRWLQRTPEGETSKGAATPSLEVVTAVAASDVAVTPGQPSALAIEVRPEQANEKSLISITGIPEGARLNAGVDAGSGNWLLPPRRLSGLTINVPAGTADATLGVQVLDSNVRTPLSEKKQFSVHVNGQKPEVPMNGPKPEPAAVLTFTQGAQQEPVALPETPKPTKPAPSFFSTQTVPASTSAIVPPPEPQAKAAAQNGVVQTAPSRQASLPGPAFDQPKTASKTEVEDLIREGNKRMKDGDILDARRLYQKAVALGDAEAALAMGRSYDPIYFARIDKKNAEPDAARAFDWYRKAMDGGAAQTAKVRIENLKHFLNQ